MDHCCKMNLMVSLFLLTVLIYCLHRHQSWASTSCQTQQNQTKAKEESHASTDRAKRSVNLWSHERETAAHFQGRVCPERCSGLRKVISKKFCPVKCFPCTCEKYCYKLGRCCPHISDPEWSPPPAERSVCMSDFFNNFILRVVACDPDYPRDETRNLCESKSVPRRRDTVLPVTSTTSSVTYINRHCAACNYDDNTTVDWSIICLHNMYLYNVTNDTQYDERAVQLPEVCKFVPSEESSSSVAQHLCSLPPKTISSCNITGQWGAEDEHLRRACEQTHWSKGAEVSVLSFSKFTEYANVFCAICNGFVSQVDICIQPQVQVDPTPQEPQGQTMGHPTRMPTTPRADLGPLVRTATGLLDQRSPVFSVNTVQTEGCLWNEWKHPKGQCRELQCTAGKLVSSRTKCATAVRRVRGLGYHLRVLLRPIRLTYNRQSASLTASDPSSISSASSTTDTPKIINTKANNSPHLCSYSSQVWKQLSRITLDYGRARANITTASTPHQACFLDEYEMQLEKLIQHGNVTGEQVQQQQLHINADAPGEASFLAAEIQADILAKSSVSRDFFEERVLSSIGDDEWTLVFDKWTVVLKALDLTSELVDRGEESAAFTTYTGSEGQTKTIPFKSELWNSHPLFGLEHLFLPLYTRLLCPYLMFERGEFEVKVSDGKVHVNFPYYLHSDLRQITFDAKEQSKGSWLESKERQLAMCFHTFQQIFPLNVTIVKPRPAVSMTRRIMSAVCGGISVVCLAITFLTYSLFRELRSLPGLNNMGLSVSLGTAQLTLLIPWHRTNIAGICRAVGLFTHWIWLMAISWMAVCCLHMVRVFVSKTRHTYNSHQRRTAFLHNVIGTILVSASIVVVTVCASLGMSGGVNMGYGGNNCFLDTGLHRLLILTFLLPLGLSVAINLVCFGITVAAIMKVRRLQAHAPRERRDILVYAKLVTVTGGAWLLGLLSELADQEWMRVAAELCTAAQGLLVFLAYVCNMRVWQLYRARFGRPVTTSITSETAVTSLKSSKTDEA